MPVEYKRGGDLVEKSDKNSLTTISSNEISTLLHGPLAMSVFKPFSKRIFLMQVRVAGLRYRDNINELLSCMKVGDKVELIREPENEYDELAIMIRNAEGQKLGYVPRVNNDIMSKMMDAGKILRGEVAELKEPVEGNYVWDALYVDIYWDESGPVSATFSLEISRPFSNRVFLACLPVIDMHKLMYLHRRLRKIKVNDRIILRRELDNECDESSIMVIDGRKHKLGNIPRSHNRILSRLMDAGKLIYAIVSDVDYEKNDDTLSRNKLTLDIYMED